MKKELFIRIFCDIITAGLSWMIFFYYRKIYIEIIPFELSTTFALGTLGVILLWMAIYVLYGNYIDIRRISKINEFARTIIQTLIGTLIIFFFLIIDDIENYRSYKYYYHAILSILIILFHYYCNYYDFSGWLDSRLIPWFSMYLTYSSLKHL